MLLLRFARKKMPDTAILIISITISPVNLKLISMPGRRTRAKKVISSAAFTISLLAVHSFLEELFASAKIMNPSSKRTRIINRNIVITCYLISNCLR